MNKIFIIIILNLLITTTIEAQILEVSLVTQEQDEWCWTGVSKCVLNYYGNSIEQCSIAEYTRNTADWHNFGSQNCCQSPNGDCNYWNYNWGYSGSIKDILIHFGNIQNVGKSNSLTAAEVSSEINKNHPLIIRWAWTTGGGHFIVGHGLENSSLYYMNPWPGEGFKIALYDWVVSSSDHDWDGTNVMLTDPLSTAITKISNKKTIEIYPNPSTGLITIELNPKVENFSVEILTISGQIVYSKNYHNQDENIVLDLTKLSNGLYFVKIKSISFNEIQKLVITN